MLPRSGQMLLQYASASEETSGTALFDSSRDGRNERSCGHWKSQGVKAVGWKSRCFAYYVVDLFMLLLLFFPALCHLFLLARFVAVVAVETNPPHLTSLRSSSPSSRSPSLSSSFGSGRSRLVGRCPQCLFGSLWVTRREPQEMKDAAQRWEYQNFSTAIYLSCPLLEPKSAERRLPAIP